MQQSRDNVDADRSRVIRRRRYLLAALLIILILPLVVVGWLIRRFDPNQYAPALISAVDRATDRQLSISGPITLKLSFTPEITVTGLSLTNPPGFPDPELLTVNRVTAKIALLPLLSRHIDILQLSLIQPVMRLERGAGSQANWDFSQAPPSAAPNNPAAPAPAKPYGYRWALEDVTIERGVLLFGNSRESTLLTLRLNSLTGKATALAAPLQVRAQAEFGKTPFSMAGVVGPVARFSGAGSGPWPVDIKLQLGAATAAVSGSVEHPRSGRGYHLKIQARVPALEDMTSAIPAAWLNGWTLPALHDLNLDVQIDDQGSVMPSVDDLSITAGRSDLSALRPGVILDSADVRMAALGVPLSLNLAGQAGNSAMSLAGNLGDLETLFSQSLLPPGAAQGSFPVSLKAQVGAAQISVNGAITAPQTLAGVALAVNATIPELSVFSPLAGQELPAWKHIQMQATLIDPGGFGLREAVGIDGLTVTMDDAAFGGEASLFLSAQPRVQLALDFIQLNLDALLAALPKPNRPANGGSLPPTEPAAPDTAENTLPNLVLPVKLLKVASADVQISADTLIWDQATFTALQGHAVLANGVLTLNPVTGQVPGGSMQADATLDTTKTPPAETLNFSAPALALAPFLAAFGLSNIAEGTVEAKLVASSSGDDLDAIAAGLDGEFGLAMVNGIVDGSVMDKLFGTVLSTVGLPATVVGAQGPVHVRCMALRMDSENGVGTIRALTLDSSRLLVQGGGSVDFGNGMLNIILRPQLDLAGTEVGVPVQVGGSFSAPTTSVAPASAVQEAAKAAIGLPLDIAQETLGANTIFGKAASVLGAGQPADVCPAALSLGRLGQPGPAAPPEAPAQGSAPAAGKLSGPRSLLDALFGK